MTFALCMQLPNALHFKKPIDIWAGFVPSMLFLQSIFGYLVVCILYKWSIDWSQSATGPPSLLTMLIDMFLSPGTVDPKTQLYWGQPGVQMALLGVAAVCVPWMLCVKPYVLWKEHQKTVAQGYQGISGEAPRGEMDQDEDEEEGAGMAVAQEMDEEHVCIFFSLYPPLIPLFSILITCLLCRSLNSAISWFIKLSIRSSSAWGVSRTRRVIFVCGRFLSRTLSFRKCCTR